MSDAQSQLHDQNLRGLELEEGFFNRLKDLMAKLQAARNVTVICCLENKGARTTKFELDFLIILGDQKTIIHVEAKASLNDIQRKKVNEQFQNGLNFFKKMDLFQRGDGWRYLQVIYTQAISPDANICDDCKPFILDSKSDLVNWWRFFLAGSNKGNIVCNFYYF